MPTLALNKLAFSKHSLDRWHQEWLSLETSEMCLGPHKSQLASVQNQHWGHPCLQGHLLPFYTSKTLSLSHAQASSVHPERSPDLTNHWGYWVSHTWDPALSSISENKSCLWYFVLFEIGSLYVNGMTSNLRTSCLSLLSTGTPKHGEAFSTMSGLRELWE